MAVDVIRGKDYCLYRNTEDDLTGYFASPVWSLVNNVGDASRTSTKTMAKTSTRGSKYGSQRGTMIELSYKFPMIADAYDADFAVFEGKFHNDSDPNIQVAILNGPIGVVGSRGIMFVAEVSDISSDEALEDVGKMNVELVVGYDPENPPTRVVVNVAGILAVLGD